MQIRYRLRCVSRSSCTYTIANNIGLVSQQFFDVVRNSETKKYMHPSFYAILFSLQSVPLPPHLHVSCRESRHGQSNVSMGPHVTRISTANSS